MGPRAFTWDLEGTAIYRPFTVHRWGLPNEAFMSPGPHRKGKGEELGCINCWGPRQEN